MTQPEGRQVNVEKVIERLTQQVAALSQQNTVQSVIIEDQDAELVELRQALAASADAAQPDAGQVPPDSEG